jgi:hypothetical protein
VLYVFVLQIDLAFPLQRHVSVYIPSFVKTRVTCEGEVLIYLQFFLTTLSAAQTRINVSTCDICSGFTKHGVEWRDN